MNETLTNGLFINAHRLRDAMRGEVRSGKTFCLVPTGCWHRQGTGRVPGKSGEIRRPILNLFAGCEGKRLKALATREAMDSRDGTRVTLMGQATGNSTTK